MKKKCQSCLTDASSSTISTAAVQTIVNKLKNERNRSSTKENYYGIWKKFNEFFIRLDEKPDSWEERLVLFIGYLINTKKKSSTIKSYISAIRAVLQADGVELNEDRYLITSLTRACRFQNDHVRIRLPIKKGLLLILIKYLDKIFGTQPYLLRLYKALFMTAYYGLFRVGELTTGSHPILARDVHNKKKMMFILRTSKTHWTDVKPQIIKISNIDKNHNADSTLSQNNFGNFGHICPFQALRDFIAVRKQGFRKSNEPFFVFSDRSPVSPLNMRNVLNQSLTLAGLEHRLYGTHSFRIGRCVDLMAMNLSVESIKKLGRWRSNCVFTYLSNL